MITQLTSTQPLLKKSNGPLPRPTTELDNHHLAITPDEKKKAKLFAFISALGNFIGCAPSLFLFAMTPVSQFGMGLSFAAVAGWALFGTITLATLLITVPLTY